MTKQQARHFVFLCCCILGTPGLVFAQSSSPSIRWTVDAKQAIVEVLGLRTATLQQLQRTSTTQQQWQRVLSVYAGDVPLAMLGTYRVQARVLQFLPQFPLEPSIAYRAVVQLPKAEPITSVFQLPATNTTPTTVVRQIYPSGDVLPENLLKFYVQFSAPMQRGEIYQYIQLRDSQGKIVELPFLEIDEELWDTTMTRLTLIIDPGRIKRGVLPLEEIGPSLEAGKSYSLVIRRDWKDGAGNPLKEEFRKSFRVAAPDREPIDPARWQWTLPKAGTREPLRVNFGEPLDAALAQRVLNLTTQAGALVVGAITLTEQEREWVFTPVENWLPGNYELVVQTTLEDLAGNNIGKPFDVDVFTGIDRHLRTSNVRLPFALR